jgi:hypothetical protein
MGIIKDKRVETMMSVQGYFEAGRFMADFPVCIPERKRSVIVILDEEVPGHSAAPRDMSEWTDTFDLLKASMNEQLEGEPERVSFSTLEGQSV